MMSDNKTESSDLPDFVVRSAFSDDGNSDSDWLDIASNRESDDNDSVSSVDSDTIGGRPPRQSLSRRSSISVGSSRDGDTDPWDGFTDDEGLVVNHRPADIDCPIMGPVSAGEDEPVGDEQTLRDALDQSMISTLGSSRTSTVHNSLRDLRLSFPDPLTSSSPDGSLSSSYDNVASPDIVEPGHLIDIDQAVESIDTAVAFEEPEHAKEQTLIPTVLTPKQASLLECQHNICLVGASSPLKWEFAEKLIRQAAEQDGFTLVALNRYPVDTVRWMHFTSASGSIQKIVKLSDLTQHQPADFEYSHQLNIVYLPCRQQQINSCDNCIIVNLPDESGIVLDSAAVDCLTVHARRMILDGQPCPVLTYDLHNFSAGAIFRKFESDLRTETLLAGFGLLFGFVALIVSIVCFVYGLSATSSTLTVPNSTIPSPSVNMSHSLSIRPSSNLAIDQPRSLSLSLYSSPTELFQPRDSPSSSSTYAEASTSTSCSCSTAVSWSDCIKASKDLIIAPATVSALSQAPAQIARHTESLTALSIRAVDSLSQIFDFTVKVIVETVSRDLKELMDALDALSNAIVRQTTGVIDKSKSTTQAVRELIHYRHERAKSKAQELKALSGRFASFAGNVVMGRTKVAQEKAHGLKHHLESSDAWRTYRKAHGEWSSTLGRKQVKKQHVVKKRSFFGMA